MKLLRIALLSLLVPPVAVLIGQTPQTTADQINAEMAKMNLQHFESYLSECPEKEIRCLWFLDGHIRVGMVMTMDLREATVYTVRDVFDHARQASQTREMSHYQTVTARELLPNLPASTPNVPFPEGLHISFWHEKKIHTVTYSKKTTPLIIQRLYDVGGGSTDFTYAK